MNLRGTRKKKTSHQLSTFVSASVIEMDQQNCSSCALLNTQVGIGRCDLGTFRAENLCFCIMDLHCFSRQPVILQNVMTERRPRVWNFSNPTFDLQ